MALTTSWSAFARERRIGLMFCEEFRPNKGDLWQLGTVVLFGKER